MNTNEIKDSIRIISGMCESIVVMGDNILDVSEIENLRLSFAKDSSDRNLAKILAIVNNQSGKLNHLADDPDNCHEVTKKYLKESDIWWDFLIELMDEVKLRLEKSNLQNGITYQIENIGKYYLVKPFMEQNGYRDGNGWWIENG